MTMGSLFSLSNVSVVIDGDRILGPIDLSVEEGESIAIIGRNGSGKTTLSRLFKKELSPYYDELAQSSMTIFGKKDWDIFDLRKRIASVSTDDERFFDPGKSVGEIILTGMFGSDAIYPIHSVTREMSERAGELMGLVGLDVPPRREFGSLSQGERRAAIIARALMPGPSVLILDEPTNSLDPVASYSFIRMIDGLISKRVTVVMVTHRLEDIPKGVGRVIAVKDGRIAADGNKVDILTSETVSEIYCAKAEVTSSDGLFSLRIISPNL